MLLGELSLAARRPQRTGRIYGGHSSLLCRGGHGSRACAKPDVNPDNKGEEREKALGGARATEVFQESGTAHTITWYKERAKNILWGSAELLTPAVIHHPGD